MTGPIGKNHHQLVELANQENPSQQEILNYLGKHCKELRPHDFLSLERIRQNAFANGDFRTAYNYYFNAIKQSLPPPPEKNQILEIIVLFFNDPVAFIDSLGKQSPIECQEIEASGKPIIQLPYWLHHLIDQIEKIEDEKPEKLNELQNFLASHKGEIASDAETFVMLKKALDKLPNSERNLAYATVLDQQPELIVHETLDDTVTVIYETIPKIPTPETRAKAAALCAREDNRYEVFRKLLSFNLSESQNVELIIDCLKTAQTETVNPRDVEVYVIKKMKHWNISNESDRAAIALACIKIAPQDTLANFELFNIKDAQYLINLIESLPENKISDEELMIKCAQQSTDDNIRHLLAAKSAKRFPLATLKALPSLDLKLYDEIALIKECFKTQINNKGDINNGRIVRSLIKKFIKPKKITNLEDRIEITKLAAKLSVEITGVMQELEIPVTRLDDLKDIAFSCAEDTFDAESSLVTSTPEKCN